VEITVSLTLLFGVILFFLIRAGQVKWWPAVVAILFGFTLSSTGASDSIEDFLNSLTDAADEIDSEIQQDSGGASGQ
jgi:hypothetical protein